ncbi:protein mono-ADP-ribosyltransferase Parp16-like isoform X2 [Drosophila busckii]|nr:protein mono-ADP-ribosyltransferase Parp16-like isoform X2 [Drosophila busckii]
MSGDRENHQLSPNGSASCSCGLRGRICACTPRTDIDSMVIDALNESRRLRASDELREQLETDLLAVDCKWVLFGMALQSYRYEQLLAPYPPAYRTPAGGHNINALSLVWGTMPEFTVVQRRLQHNALPPEQVELLHWLLLQSGTPNLSLLLRQQRLQLWHQLQQRPQPRPQLVFRVGGALTTPLLASECVFYSGDMEELYALISGRSQNAELEFYDELELACQMAEWCPGWGYSLCGSLLRCVAVCQQPSQLHAEQPQLPQVRYLLFYSLNFMQHMQRLRRRQWKLLQQKQLQQQQRQQQQQQQQQQQPPPTELEVDLEELEHEEFTDEQLLEPDELLLAPQQSVLTLCVRSSISRLLPLPRLKHSRRRHLCVAFGLLTLASLSLLCKNLRLAQLPSARWVQCLFG